MISGGVDRDTLLDLTFGIGLAAMVIIAYRHDRHPFRISLGYLYVYSIALLCALALLLNLRGLVWNGTALALRAYDQESLPESEGMQAMPTPLPQVGHFTSVHPAPPLRTRSELLQRLGKEAIAVLGMSGLLWLHLRWGKQMARRAGPSPIGLGYRYALAVVGFLLFLSYAEDFLFTAGMALENSVDWQDDLGVRYWMQNLVGYGLNGFIAVLIWILSWRRAWRSATAPSTSAEEENAS